MRFNKKGAPKEMLSAWVKAEQTDRVLQRWEEQHPEEFAAYRERQKAMESLKVGDRVMTYLGEAEIVKKHRKNWDVKRIGGSGQTLASPR